jgi:protein-disulfide isomerase
MGKLQLSFNRAMHHRQGGIFAPVELVQYGDFQSNDCAAVFDDVKLLLETLGSRICFVYLHFPLHKIHPLALDAAIAAEAAAAQGKFWEMHDHIYQNQEDIQRSTLWVYAKTIGLDMVKFAGDIKQKSLFYRVINDFESGKRSGVDKVPAFFINGHRYNGPINFDGLYRACKNQYNMHSFSV